MRTSDDLRELFFINHKDDLDGFHTFFIAISIGSSNPLTGVKGIFQNTYLLFQQLLYPWK